MQKRDNPSPAFVEGSAALIGAGKGDHLAFGQLYTAYAPRVFGLALAVIHNQAMAEEVTQEVFLELWRKASRFDPARGSATAWILTLTKSRAIDQVRRAELTRARDTKWTQGHIDRDFDSVTEAALTDLEHGQVGAAMAALSVAQRQAIVLTYFRGLSTTEISRLLLIPASTVKTRCRDGLIRMRTEMTETVKVTSIK